MDDKLLVLEANGHIVPDKSILKTPAQIEAIKKSAALNTAVLDHVAANIKAGKTAWYFARIETNLEAGQKVVAYVWDSNLKPLDKAYAVNVTATTPATPEE